MIKRLIFIFLTLACAGCQTVTPVEQTDEPDVWRNPNARYIEP